MAPGTASHEPLTVYLLDISYFSGKLEAYLRYQEIEHHRPVSSVLLSSARVS